MRKSLIVECHDHSLSRSACVRLVTSELTQRIVLMQWVNALSTQGSLEFAVREVIDQALAQLQSVPVQTAVAGSTRRSSRSASQRESRSAASGQRIQPNLAILFVSSAFTTDFMRVMPLIQTFLQVDVLIGCSGRGVVGGGQEIEDGPAISLSLAVLPDVTIHPFYLEPQHLPDMDAAPDQWIELIGVSPSSQPHFVLLSGTSSMGIPDLLRGLDFAYPNSVKIGGLASSGNTQGPHDSVLFLGRFQKDTQPVFQTYRSGVVGIALSGNIAIDAVVAQGCRPIGRPVQVTKAEANIIIAIEDQHPLDVIQDLVIESDPREQRLIRDSLFVGLLMDSFNTRPERGDFLIRGMMGFDPRTGVVAVGDRIRPGQIIQFHLRDARRSEEDLRWVLQRSQMTRRSLNQADPIGALMFACVGRGVSLYDQPNFDTRIIQEIFGDREPLPLGGFFCSGEIGPVGKSTFLHGYTSVIALFGSVV